MFYSITGKVILTEPGTVVIETGGIGYRLTVSGKTLGYAAENAGTENVSLFTYLSVREDAIELFGFYSKSELDMFKRLISVFRSRSQSGNFNSYAAVSGGAWFGGYFRRLQIAYQSSRNREKNCGTYPAGA